MSWNEFDINFDLWYIDGFTYEEDGGSGDDMDWLAYYSANTQEVTGLVFGIEGLEPLQKAFEKDAERQGSHPADLQHSRDWCEQIIIARFMELMYAAQTRAKEKKMAWAQVPLYCTTHAYDFVVRSSPDS